MLYNVTRGVQGHFLCDGGWRLDVVENWFRHLFGILFKAKSVVFERFIDTLSGHVNINRLLYLLSTLNMYFSMKY